MRTSRLTAVLERTLDAKAAQATDPDGAATVPPFDPTRPAAPAGRRQRARRSDDRRPLTPVPPGSEDRPSGRDDCDLPGLPVLHGSTPSRVRRVLVPVAACVAVAIGLVGAIVLPDGNGGDDTDLAVRPLELGDPPEGWLLPAWVPDGMELWGLDTTSYEPREGSGPATIPQLFGDPAGERAVYITSSRYEISPATAHDVAVRGTAGSAGTGWGAAEEELGDAVSWDERGVHITALYRGVGEAEAIAFLDALEWRTDDPLDGFAPPADETWPLRAEATSRSTVTRDVSMLYREGVPTTNGTMAQGLWVQTSSSSAISAGYLETWYLEGQGDGTEPLVTSRDESEVSAYWPDGRSVSVLTTDPEAAGSLSPDVLERIASSTGAASSADLAAVRADLGNRIAALPLAATTDTEIGSIEVRTAGDLVRLCLRGPGAPQPDCDTSMMGGGASDDGSARATAQWTVDSTWYVAVASRGEMPQIFGSVDRTARPSTEGRLEAAATSVDDWTFQVVEPPPGIESVCVGNEDAMSCIPRQPE